LCAVVPTHTYTGKGDEAGLNITKTSFQKDNIAANR